jgi:hypothetical protein
MIARSVANMLRDHVKLSVQGIGTSMFMCRAAADRTRDCIVLPSTPWPAYPLRGADGSDEPRLRGGRPRASSHSGMSRSCNFVSDSARTR